MVKKTSKSIPKGPTGRGGRARTQSRKPRAARRQQPSAVEAPTVEATVDPTASVEFAAPLPDIALSAPEARFAARVPPPEPERLQPTARRAIFFDVENASRPEHIARVIEHLAVDRMGQRTDFVAAGNWRVIGHDTARLLSRHGAQLVHSAPSVGVRDWSDLRIAVAAGVWLAGARPGDMLEIVTSDRAFDAVGDVAASLGIAFRRLSYQGIAGTSTETLAPAREPAAGSRSRHRGRARGPWRERAPRHAAAPAHGAARSRASTAGPAAESVLRLAPGPIAEPHTAPHDEIIAVVHDLMRRSARAVTLDTLANELKARGFSRPSGSPRLITRLRRIKEIELSRSGVLTLVGGEAVPAVSEAPVVATSAPEPTDVEPGPEPGNEALTVSGSEKTPSSRPRRSRRGGRGRRRPAGAPAAP